MEGAKDPDEYIIKYGNARFQTLIDKALSVIEFKVKILKQNLNLDITNDKIKFLNEIAKLISKVDNTIEKEVYIEKISKEDIPNIRLLRIDALQLNDIFDKEIDTIYLNFSDPWPKNRHAKRRLTSEVFLKVYDDVFKNEKKIIQKTDNDLLFESSLVSLSEYGYILKEVCLDLHNNINISNCMTEYEEKFSKLGIKIKYLKAVKK